MNVLKLFQTNIEMSLKILLILKLDSYHFAKMYVTLNTEHLIFRRNSIICFASLKCMNSWI